MKTDENIKKEKNIDNMLQKNRAWNIIKCHQIYEED